jgi:hypothetical protein
MAFSVLARMDLPLPFAASLSLGLLVERPFLELRRALTPHR